MPIKAKHRLETPSYNDGDFRRAARLYVRSRQFQHDKPYLEAIAAEIRKQQALGKPGLSVEHRPSSRRP